MVQAEERFMANDIYSAYCLILQAQSVCSSPLPRVIQTITAYNVHIVADSMSQRMSSGYWHTILGSLPGDDIQAIKCQYKKMCLWLHPDKNLSCCCSKCLQARLGGVASLVNGAVRRP